MLKVILSLIALVTFASACVVTDENGASYDLTGLSTRDTMVKTDEYISRFRLCEPVSELACRRVSGAVCLYESPDSYYANELIAPLALWNQSPDQPAIESIEDGVQLTYTNGPDYYTLDPIVIFRIHCSKTVKVDVDVQFGEFTFTYNIDHPAGCAI